MFRKTGFVCLRSRSGVPIWFFPMRHVKTVSMGMLIKVGTRDEGPNERGIAHATEHMLFQGGKIYPNNQVLTDQIESVGGYLNAYTDKFMTFYHHHLPVLEVERGFKVLSQMLNHSTFKPKKISLEMQNIIQEIRSRKDKPSYYAYDMFCQTLYGQHLLGKNVLGSEESVLCFRKQDFQRFTSRFYIPDNFTFIIVGNITPKQVLRLFNQYFPEPLVGQPNQRASMFKTEPTSRELIIEKEIDQTHLYFGATTAECRNQSVSALNIFEMMIDGGSSFPLYQEVRDKRGLCYEVWASNSYRSDLGFFTVYVGTDPRKTNEAFNVSMRVIQQNKNSQKLLDRAKRMLLGNLTFYFQKPSSILKKAASSIALWDKPYTYEGLVENIKSVTIERVKEAVNRFLTPDKIVKVIMQPRKK